MVKCEGDRNCFGINNLTLTVAYGQDYSTRTIFDIFHKILARSQMMALHTLTFSIADFTQKVSQQGSIDWAYVCCMLVGKSIGHSLQQRVFC